MHYIEVTCNLKSQTPELISAYLITGLGDIGYESFDENENIIKAYIPEETYNETLLQELINDIPAAFGTASCEMIKIEQQNWNAEWEKNFEPVVVSEKVLIKASFHKNLPDYPYEIIINPKMSFGTGHHSTTALMVKTMIDVDFNGKKVLDMGSGTGILAILAKKLGATEITAIDIDEWAVSNAEENFQLNNITGYELLKGGAELLSGREFDIILANINRNILVEDMNAYTSSLKSGGMLIISGIYVSDLEHVREATDRNNLSFRSYLEKNSWIAAWFIKE